MCELNEAGQQPDWVGTAWEEGIDLHKEVSDVTKTKKIVWKTNQ